MRVTIPGRVDGCKNWAKALNEVDPGKDGGYAFGGAWLDRGAVYDLPEGLMVVTVDKRGGQRDYSVTVTLWKVPAGGLVGELEQVRVWTNKRGRIGPQIIKGISGRFIRATTRRKGRTPLARYSYTPFADAPPRHNTRPAKCRHCRQQVPALEGVLVREGDRMRVAHNGVCPPRPPLSNSYPGECVRCGGWILPGAGHLVERDPDARMLNQVFFGDGCAAKYAVVCHEDCPLVPEPRPVEPDPGPRPNQRPGSCALCHQRILAGQGHLVGPRGKARLVHPQDCPPYPHNPDDAPTWMIRERDDGAGICYDYPAGTIARVDLPEGGGWRRKDGKPVQAIGVVLSASVTREHDPDEDEWRDVVTTVWRVATDPEAAPILAREADRQRRAALAGRARRLLATMVTGAPADAVAPTPEEMNGAGLACLPAVPLPAATGGTGSHETRVHVDETAGVVWTVVHNGLDGDDWSRSNWGGYIAWSHPLTADRRRLLEELRSGASSV